MSEKERRAKKAHDPFNLISLAKTSFVSRNPIFLSFIFLSLSLENYTRNCARVSKFLTVEKERERGRERQTDREKMHGNAICSSPVPYHFWPRVEIPAVVYHRPRVPASLDNNIIVVTYSNNVRSLTCLSTYLYTYLDYCN